MKISYKTKNLNFSFSIRFYILFIYNSYPELHLAIYFWLWTVLLIAEPSLQPQSSYFLILFYFYVCGCFIYNMLLLFMMQRKVISRYQIPWNCKLKTITSKHVISGNRTLVLWQIEKAKPSIYWDISLAASNQFL